jgi:hypothetical protein
MRCGPCRARQRGCHEQHRPLHSAPRLCGNARDVNEEHKQTDHARLHRRGQAGKDREQNADACCEMPHAREIGQAHTVGEPRWDHTGRALSINKVRKAQH